MSASDALLQRQAQGLPVTEGAMAVMACLGSPQLRPAPIIKTDGRAIVLDLGAGSESLGEPLRNLPVERFGQLVDRAMANAGTAFAFGRWGEPRDLYSNDLFDNEAGASSEKRSVHMGLDLFCVAETPVYAPLDGRIHIKANNAAELDYGPLLVLEHETPSGETFYSLYGHLSSAGVAHVEQGQAVAAGARIATVGAPPENGNWPPHLHFQLILDLLGLGADFPGVAYPSQQSAWLALSPLPAMFFPECDPDLLDGRATVPGR
jgi:murein DD-endopeptidase MepM/ murein hydrolase activator NlpD